MTSYYEGRKRIVKDVRKYVVRRGDIEYPPKDAFDGEEEPKEVWRVWLTIQEGMLPETSETRFFRSNREADKYIAEHPVGSEFPDTLLPEITNRVPIDDWVESGFFPISAGDADLYLPWRVLQDAKITNEIGIGPSEQVLLHLGQERVHILKEKYGGNWSAVAEFEYCLRTLPRSSPAFIAAACDFCHFVLEDDFKAGYLLRDLEVLVHGVEEEATKVLETRKKAGASGSKKSSQARKARRTAFLIALEDVARRNPDLVKLGEEPLARLALTRAVETDSSLWRQGQGQVMEYLGEIRRGEAGSDMQMRYQEIFGKKPPKRRARF